jgi:hypothetical protein
VPSSNTDALNDILSFIYDIAALHPFSLVPINNLFGYC